MPLTPIDVGGPAQPMLSVRGLVKHFPLKKDLLGRSAGVVRGAAQRGAAQRGAA
jgi:peptide/nickel transport system ATP-binding protein